VNDKQQLAELERSFQLWQALLLLKQGATIRDPSRLDIRGQVHLGKDVLIDVNVIFEGNVVLGDHVVIGPQCIIRDCQIGDHTVIRENSVLEKSQIGPDCVIGPFARLRPGTYLDEGVHIGNFVEVKNSEIGSHTKACHLSYLGDAVIGTNVNIGAGTITCNYDGTNKHQTTIGDHSFIGSGTELVAPVRIGRGGTIGAGSTITKDTPEHELVLARAKQTVIRGWQRPVKQKQD
jgi:bifunctional UDP-N-acetylglucosamine pyrophosphorylase / glucosamine-1-phosphate N-acetyltransferase